ncbi:hypothetical protein ACTFIT_007033 [Dictyostelium discoideum]
MGKEIKNAAMLGHDAIVAFLLDKSSTAEDRWEALKLAISNNHPTTADLSDNVSGKTCGDPKGYLTDLRSKRIASDAEVGDIKKARLLFKSATTSNPKHSPSWIAAAKLEVLAGKIVDAPITSAPVLAKPDFTKSFNVYIDASDIGTDCFIMQDDGNVVDSTSSKESYSTTDREFLVFINVLDRYGYMLKDKKFRVFTDHLNLTYNEELKETTKRIIRYLDKASEYKFEVINVR